ncbi:sulfatase [Candidatus Latescibacterota bacterium]
MASMQRRDFLNRMAAGAVGASALHGAGSSIAQARSGKKSNFVVLFADDMGYGDWNRGGHPTIRTPNLNRMADEGVQLTQFYSGNPVCSPSRSALLTGRNCIRTGVVQVFFPGNGTGMSTDEVTIADMLKPQGYATACVGKWHLGSTYEFRPLRQGFDYYYGILYSNDMYRPDIFRNDERIESPSDQTTLTKRYTEEAVKFIERSKDQPFFLYLPYTMPHVPLFTSDKFKDTSKRGLYGDVIEEIDWSVGQILDTLRKNGLDDNTLVIFTSDNGPWITYDLEGGSSGQLRGAKGDTWEGGMREPTVAWMPGTIPAGRVNMDVGSTLDFFPTFAKLAGAKMPDDRPYDGIDLMPTLQEKASRERTIYYYNGHKLCAVRKGKWKLHFCFYDHSRGGFRNIENWMTPDRPYLYNLETDPSEKHDIAGNNPDVVKDLTAVAQRYEKEIERNGENRELLDWFRDEWATAAREGE